MAKDDDYSDEWMKGEEPAPKPGKLSKLKADAKKRQDAEATEFEEGWGLVPDEATDGGEAK